MKKIYNVLLTFLLICTLIPINVSAEGEGDFSTPTDTNITETDSSVVETNYNEDLGDNNIDTTQDETPSEMAENASDDELAQEVEINQENNEETEILEGKAEENYPIFSENKTIDGVVISVNAEEGVFPEGSKLSVEKVVYYVQKQVDNALNEVRNEEANVVASYTFDIKILDSEGNEIQPKDDSKVKVSFALAEATNENLETNVYHIDDKQEEITSDNVQTLDVVTEGEEIVVETNGFSIYTVEFTYNNKQYVLEGDSYVRLDDILSSVELSGVVEKYEVSNFELFNVFRGDENGIEYVENYDDNGNLVEYYPINKEDGNTLYMVALQPFTTQEWLKVVIDGIEYTIVVTDAIRTDENGDQVGTNVRFMQESTTIGTITDSRVIQGPTENDFTASMPLAEIYIDDTIVNQTLWSKDEYNGTRVIAELLVDNTQGKYAGFQINMNTDTNCTDKGSLQNSYGGVWYDFTKRYLNDTQNLTVSGSSANNYELFSGDIVKYTLKGMATKFDVASNAYKNYDVVITYSDILITLCQNSGTGAVNQANISSTLKLIDTNMVNFAWTGGFRAGLSYNVNVKVVDPDTGALIDGSYYYPMTDIDIGRTGIGGFANLYNASNLNRYSEQVALMSNYGRPTSSGSWEQMVWIPGGNYSAAPFTNKANVTENNYPYTCNITSKTIDGQANALLISPGGTTTAVSGKITSAGGVDKDNTFYSGFITLANNTAGGINVKGYASAPTSGGVESYILTGSQIVNHKVDASSDVGGTIFTTTTGNADGSLSGGTLLGYNEINKPFEISAATGQSVTYTMTPKGGYKLKNVWVKDGDIDIMTIVNTAKATVNENDYDTNSDGELDENERQAYEAAVETAINTALASDSDTSAISISSLTSLGKGVYTYTFNGIQTDKSVHIDWEKTDLTVTKELDPVMQNINDKFKFRIELSDTTTEETTWRVRAKKNTGTLNYAYPLEDGKPYYMTYYESRTEEVPYKYVVVSDTTDKNPYEEGWYYYQNGTYYPTYDTTLDSDITYYVKDDTQTSTITNYYHHILGWNETTQTWDDKVVTAPNSITTNVNLGTENLNKELSDDYRFVSDGTHVYSVSSYDEIEEEYTDYLIWVLDDTINQEVLVVGNLEMYPDGRVFIADYNSPSRYTYIFNDGIEDYSRKIIHYRSNQVIDDITYNYSLGHYKYEFVEDASSPIYYNLENNPEGYTLDSGYSAVEGESGLYIITLPAGQNPDTIDLLNNGWEVAVSRVGAIEDDFDLEQAMIQAGATPVQGAVNTFEFTLGVGETIDFNGVIPMGYNYTISEVLSTNSRWQLLRTSGNDTISDFDGEENVTFTNTEKRYDITIEKQTIDDVTGSFDFTLEIYREHIDFGQVYGVSVQAYKNSQDATPTYKLSNSGSPLEISIDNITATIPTSDYILGSGNSNLDSLINYLIDMDNSANHSMHIGSEEADASTGVHTSLSSQVQEYIDGGYTTFSIEPVGYEFSTKDIVTKIPYIPNTLPPEFSGSNGVFTTTVSNDDSKTFTDIPFGYKYEITETLPQGWENESKVNEKGTLNNTDVVSTWVNKQKTYSLTINKETVNNDNGTFNFVLVVYGETQFFKADIERHSWSNIYNGNLENYSCSFENQKFKYIPGLEFINNRQGDDYPHYRIAEYFDGIDGGFVWTGGDGGGQYNANDFYFGESSVYEFTPTGIYSNGNVMIRPESIKDTYTFAAKAFNSYDIDTQSYTYEIYESKYDPYADNKFFNNELGYSAHVNEFTLNNGESLTIPNIPYGYNYEVYEVDSQGNKVLVGSNIGSTEWKLKSIDGNNIGTINQDTEVTFTNELDKFDIEVNKTVTGLKGDKNKEFEFEVKVWKNGTETTEEYIARTEAYAVFDTSNNSLTFFRDDKNKYTNEQQEGTKVYFTGVENTGTTRQSVPWQNTQIGIIGTEVVNFVDIIKPAQTAYWFRQFNVTSFEGLEFLDTSQVTTMERMFDRCTRLTTLDLSHLDTSNVTNMDRMFEECGQLTSINSNSFDTSNLVTANRMFKETERLTGTLNILKMPLEYNYMGTDTLMTFKFGESVATSDIELLINSCNQNERDCAINGGTSTFSAPLPLAEVDSSKLLNKTNDFDKLKDIVGLSPKLDENNDGVADDGVYIFKLKHGQKFTLTNIPYGYQYEVTEKDYSSDMYTTTVDGDSTREVSGIVDSNKTHNYINDKNLADLTITKRVDGNMGDKYKEFEFEVRVYGWKNLFTDETVYQNFYSNATLRNPDRNQDLIDKIFGDYISQYVDIAELSGNEIDVTGRIIYNNQPVQNGEVSYWYYGNIYNMGAQGHSDFNWNNRKGYYSTWEAINIINGLYVGGQAGSDSSYAIPGENITTAGADILEYIDLSKYGGIYNPDTENGDLGSGTYTFTLSHGESINLENIPAGYTYEVVEVDYSEEGYKTYTDLDIFNQNREITGTLDSNKSHTFKNVNNAAVPTEIRIASYGAGLVGISILVILLIKRNRRKSYAS